MAAIASLMTIMLFGGCPVAQQPTTPTDEQEQLEPPAVPGADDDLDRPIPPPDLDGDDDQDDSDGGDIVDGGGGAGGGGGEGDGGPSSDLVTVDEPAGDLAVRPGTLLNVEFHIRDPQGALVSVELVLVRDDDGDGSPVLDETLSFQAGDNIYSFDTTKALGLLKNGFARLLVGIRYKIVDGQTKFAYASGSLSIDSQAPTGQWISPPQDLLLSRSTQLDVSLSTTDNRPVTVKVLLDPDQTPGNGGDWTLIPDTELSAGTNVVLERTVNLQIFPSGSYYYYVTVSDGIEPAFGFYAETQGTFRRLGLTDRLIGDFPLEDLAPDPNDPTDTGSDHGGILQGFNFNDLAGSSMARVPDLTGDGLDELIIGSRFGKAYIIENNGVGFGEAYMIYGSGGRLRGVQRLNSVGNTISGLVFPGIRTPLTAGIAPPNESTRWTSGLSDVSVVDDMDGDDLPELVFSFPRVESINLGETDPTIQHPDLQSDVPGMGNLEYNAFYITFMIPVWHPDEAQFTRGGVVVVSSHNEILRNPNLLNRKGDRVFDLHETGQLFNTFRRPGLVPYIRQALTRTQIDGEPFTVCADCDDLPPDGCEPGEINGVADDDPNRPPDDPDDTPGNCGDDGCDLNMTSLQDGREQVIQRWIVQWDTIFDNQGPGGFHQSWTIPPAEPPLVKPLPFPFTSLYPFPFGFYPNHWVYLGDACLFADGCEVTNEWYSWYPTLPCTTLAGTPAWATAGNPFQDPLPDCYPDNICEVLVEPEDGPCPEPDPPCSNPDVTATAGGYVAWTGFYGPYGEPRFTVSTGETFPALIGARVLGQAVDDQFGTTVASDGTWLYISAPERTVNGDLYGDDVPTLPDDGDGVPGRDKSGVVYQLRTNAPPPAGGPTRTQLWLEPGQTWPYADAEDPGRRDISMPVPHQYIIESVGSRRGNPDAPVHDTAYDSDGCPPDYDPGTDQPDARACYASYPVGTAGYYMDRTWQIVGPHVGAKISFVRALGDLNDDGTRDFAVGSPNVKQAVVTPGDPPTVDFAGPEVGSIFIVYGRSTGLEGDYLLEQLAKDVFDPERLNGVLLQGKSSGETLARVFDDAGDFNGDERPDVIVGNEGADNNTGEAIVLFGSAALVSPAGGWTTDTIPPGRAIRFVGENPGDLAGGNVAGAGDVDNDGYADILIAAPGAQGGRGVVYLIYGSDSLGSDVNLADTGTFALPGAKFIGRSAGDALGGGEKTVANTDFNGGSTTAFSRGVVRLGDIDGDGRADYAIGAMLADLVNKTDAGEIYILYGVGD